MSKSLIVPVNPSVVVPVNRQRIQHVIEKTGDKDSILYEYELVDKDKEAKLARRIANKRGLCLCARWIFLLLGNTILVALTCSICAILLYVNTQDLVTNKPLLYGQSCTTGSDECDAVRYLVCTSGTCVCPTGVSWNGTDCTCGTNEYWDGQSCVQNQGYGQRCSSTVPCYSQFTCDSLTSTCLCASAFNYSGTFIYTKYYTGTTLTPYTGACFGKGGSGTGCITYGVSSCQEWLGLTCSLNSGGVYLCSCYSGYFWDSNFGSCRAIQTLGGSCAGNTLQACNTTASLYCDTSLSTPVCSCPSTHYWNNNLNSCIVKGLYAAACNSNSWCNTGLGLYCYFTSSGNTPCNCPTTTVNGMCDCPTSGTLYYWDGQKCSTRVGLNSACPGQYACLSGTCAYGYCL